MNKELERKASQWQIGDWCQFKTDCKEKIYSRINCISPYQKYAGHTDNATWFDSFDEIEGIPLTEDMLKANGFMFDSVEQEYLFEGFPSVLIDYYSVCMYWQGHLLRFHYVHELQHALRLCMLNDLADKFKVTPADGVPTPTSATNK